MKKLKHKKVKRPVKHMADSPKSVVKRAEKLAAELGKTQVPRVMLRPASLLEWAETSLERAAAQFIGRLNPNILAAYIRPEQRRFVFRCHLVPLYSRATIKFAVQREGGPKYWLHEHGTSVLALERMTAEFQIRYNHPGLAECGVIAAMLNSPEGPAYWQRRFFEWRDAAERSYVHFIAKPFPDVKKLEGDEARVAHLGAIKRLSGTLPDDLFGSMINRCQSDNILASIFKRNAQRTRTGRSDEPTLDTWLLEIWPLVTEYGWRFLDVWHVANAKWDETTERAFDSADILGERCKRRLGLRLSPQGRAKQGRPRNGPDDGEVTLPPLARLAVDLQPIAWSEEEWVLGQTID